MGLKLGQARLKLELRLRRLAQIGADWDRHWPWTPNWWGLKLANWDRHRLAVVAECPDGRRLGQALAADAELVGPQTGTGTVSP